ncbi:MAG: MFS transporter [Betaproteobacteria bacterium]|jgi:MFS family permease|nr:MAG: MFS transporter [Betaproteobacteria bacterium]
MTGFLLPLIITLAVQVQASLVVFTPPILAPVAQGDVGVSAAAVGLVTALVYVLSVPSALFSGKAIERLGAIRVSQLCLLFSSCGMALMAIPNPWVIALGALIIGIGYGAVTPASSTVLADKVPGGLRALIFSIKQTGVPIGGAIAGALVPFLLVLVGWQSAAIAVALIGVLVIAAAQPIRRGIDLAQPYPAARRGGGLLEPLRLVFSHARLRELAISSFAFSGMQMCLGTYLVVVLADRAHLSVSAAGGALSVAMVAGIIGRLLWGVLADYGFSSRSVLGLLGVMMAACAVLITLIDNTWTMGLIYLLSFVFGASAIGWNGVYLAEVARIAPPGQAGSATGASLAMTYSGVVVSPSLVWLTHAITDSYASGFILVGLLALWRGMVFFRGA